jgi:two-component system, LytTR family, sensor kinase
LRKPKSRDIVRRMDAPVIRRSRIILLTLGVGLFFTAEPLLMGIAAGRPVSFQRDFLQELFYWLVWAALSPLIIAAARRWPLDAGHLGRPIAIHMTIAAVLAPLQAIVAFGLHSLELVLAGVVPPSELGALILQRRLLVLWGFFTGAYFYWVVVGLYTALRFRELYAAERLSVATLDARRAALEGELVRVRLDALQSQLHPHFLFNTLNAIAVLAQEDVEKARQMLFRLGSLLRRSLDEVQHEVPLLQEIGFLEEYLDIQRVRFGDRLVVTLEIDRAAADTMVPVFFLQPLTENAIEHGGADPGKPAVILLRARVRDDLLSITIEDNGSGLGEGTAVREGVGLGNTRERLRRLYGERASLTLGRATGSASSGARVEIRIPVRRPVACAS